MKQQSDNASILRQLLAQAQQKKQQVEQLYADDVKVHIAETGGTLTAAYEQLRNAAEYAEEHLLLQRAIRRFYKRLFLLRDRVQLRDSGQELAIELTQAGYVLNDTIPEGVVNDISQLAERYFVDYERLAKRHSTQREAEQWLLDPLAVRIEWMLNSPTTSNAYVQFVHHYFTTNHDLEALFKAKAHDIELSLYVAIHRALLKSDNATIRTSLLDIYAKQPGDADYETINAHINTLLSSSLSEQLFRYVDRKGAPLRVLRHMIEGNDMIAHDLANRDVFLANFTSQVESDYSSINTRINRGIIKSVIFLIITKFLIGLAIEIPYDYLMIGAIVWLPLLINLFFPPVYMVLLRMTLMLPSDANTRRLTEQIEAILYKPAVKQLERKPTVNFGIGYNIAYGLAFLTVFGGVGLLLWHFAHFEVVHLFIFFLFLSGASFLGFRLSRMIREIEAVGSNQNAVTTVRDFLYMPFVVVGRFMSEKYSKVNIVALMLDMVIELPLKTILRLIRQWGAFIGSKQDQL